MKKLPWKNLARYGALGCGLLGTVVAAKEYGLESKWKENFSLLGFPHQALSNNNSTSNQNAATVKEVTNILDMKMLLPSKGKLSECKDVEIANERELELNESQALEYAIEKASALCQKVCDKYGLPGLAVGVSVNGKLVWEKGFGYADVENSVPMNPRMIMRIASISKSMTAAMLGKLMDQGLIDLDATIQKYLPKFPIKYVDGKQVNITVRHLVSHLSGIRHYHKKGEKEANPEIPAVEFFMKDHFDSVEKALELFQNDDLFHEPGTKCMYTTHGWTVVAAIIEKIVEKPFDKYSKITFRNLGLKNTYLDEHEPIIYNRVRYYTRDKYGILRNSPYVDTSYKWAGGGFLSNITDLMQFMNILLYSLQCSKTHTENKNAPYISKDTVQKLWTGDPRANISYLGAPSDLYFGVGFVEGDAIQKCMFCKTEDLVTVFHDGGAVGASSVVLVKFPKNFESSLGENNGKSEEAVKGVIVAMLTNLTNVPLTGTSNDIADLFKEFL